MSEHPAWVVKSVNISTNEVVLGARLASDLATVAKAVSNGLELGAVIVGIPAAPVGAPLDDVADLRREVERLKEEAAKVRQDNLHLLSELGQTRAVAHDHGRLVVEIERLTRERDDARIDAERLTAEVTRLRTAAEEDKSPGSSYFSGFLEARLRVREYLENREARLVSAKKESERLREESANAASRVMALTYECTALDEALDAIGEEPA